jgi:hypothetical protein
MLTTLAGAAHLAYRALVWDDPRFVEFFRAFTPVDELALFEIGSRPARRPGAEDYLPRLRAIPWVFAWTQNRCLLPAWYGCGAALELLAGTRDGLRELRRLYSSFAFFRSLVENLEMTLAKSSLEIARGYLELVPAELEPERRLATIAAEHARTVEAVKAIVGARALLDRHPVLQRSIRLRNPYVDPMNAIQALAAPPRPVCNQRGARGGAPTAAQVDRRNRRRAPKHRLARRGDAHLAQGCGLCSMSSPGPSRSALSELYLTFPRGPSAPTPRCERSCEIVTRL